MMLVNIQFTCKMVDWVHSFVHSFMEFVELLLCPGHRDYTVTKRSIFSAFMKHTCQRRNKIRHQRQP